jgi:hypothetical protein
MTLQGLVRNRLLETVGQNRSEADLEPDARCPGSRRLGETWVSPCFGLVSRAWSSVARRTAGAAVPT